MKSVHEHTKKKECTHIIMQNTFSGRSLFLLLVSTLPAMENASSVSHSSLEVTSYQYQKHPEIVACLVDSHFSTAFFGATSLCSSGCLEVIKQVRCVSRVRKGTIANPTNNLFLVSNSTVFHRQENQNTSTLCFC